MKSFREILLKKSDSDHIDFLIKHIREDVLEDMIIESLEKMAAVMSPNSIVSHYAHNSSKSQDGKALRDALGHHASHYKSALKSGNKELADKHMKQIYNIAHVAKSVDYITNGEKIKFEHANPHAWEANFTHENWERNGGKKPSDTVGFKLDRKRPNFDFLRQPPHDSRHHTIDSAHHGSGYPLEEMKINGKHIHIDDLENDDKRGYVPHEYDNHPVFQHNRTRSNKVSEDDNEKYPQAHHDYYGSEHHSNYKNRHAEMKEKDPEAYKARGLSASEPVHGKAEKKSKEYDESMLPPELQAAMAANNERVAEEKNKTSKEGGKEKLSSEEQGTLDDYFANKKEDE